jgi:hypothetical protein
MGYIYLKAYLIDTSFESVESVWMCATGLLFGGDADSTPSTVGVYAQVYRQSVSVKRQVKLSMQAFCRKLIRSAGTGPSPDYHTCNKDKGGPCSHDGQSDLAALADSTKLNVVGLGS